MLVGGRGVYLVLFVLFFLIFFPSGKCYFILLVGGVRDLSSAGQSLTCISILEAYISFEGGCTVLAVSKNHYCIYPKYILLIICNFYMFFTFVLAYACLFMCLFVHKCVVVQLSVSYGI